MPALLRAEAPPFLPGKPKSGSDTPAKGFSAPELVWTPVTVWDRTTSPGSTRLPSPGMSAAASPWASPYFHGCGAEGAGGSRHFAGSGCSDFLLPDAECWSRSAKPGLFVVPDAGPALFVAPPPDAFEASSEDFKLQGLDELKEKVASLFTGLRPRGEGSGCEATSPGGGSSTAGEDSSGGTPPRPPPPLTPPPGLEDFSSDLHIIDQGLDSECDPATQVQEGRQEQDPDMFGPLLVQAAVPVMEVAMQRQVPVEADALLPMAADLSLRTGEDKQEQHHEQVPVVVDRPKQEEQLADAAEPVAEEATAEKQSIAQEQQVAKVTTSEPADSEEQAEKQEQEETREDMPKAAAASPAPGWGDRKDRGLPREYEETATAATTSFLLQNIPRRCSRDILVARLEAAGFKGEVDFLYLPVNLQSKCHLGHAVVNFRTEEAGGRFVQLFHKASVKQAFPGLSGQKPCEVAPAPVQGRSANVRKLQRQGLLLSLLSCRPEWLPQLFDEEGAPLPFPEQPKQE